MLNEFTPPRLAVLIDAENVPAKAADEVFAAIARMGEPVVRRIYGDFSNPRLAGWHKALARHALTAHQQFSVATGKNAADIALVIDAMDLLHAGRVDGFCLVTSDSDFTRLATRIREHGCEVYGFGGPATPESFRAACRPFLHLTSMAPAGTVALVPAIPKAVIHLATSAVVVPIPSAPSSQAPSQAPSQPAGPEQRRQVASRMLRHAFQKIPVVNGWAHLSPLGKVLRDENPGFEVKQYGFSKLVDLVAASGAFDLEKREGSILVRPRPAARAVAGQPATPPTSQPAGQPSR